MHRKKKQKKQIVWKQRNNNNNMINCPKNGAIKKVQLTTALEYVCKCIIVHREAHHRIDMSRRVTCRTFAAGKVSSP